MLVNEEVINKKNLKSENCIQKTDIISVKSDAELVLELNAGSNDAVKELLNRHSGLISRIYSKYLYALSQTHRDIENEKFYILFLAASKFNPAKQVKFSSWLGSYTRYHCLHQINKNNGWYLIDCRDADSLYKNIAEKTKPDHTQSTEYIYHVLGKLNDKRILDIFKLRYSGPKEKMTFREIGRSLGVSGQTVLNLYNKGKKILKEKLVNGSEMDIV